MSYTSMAAGLIISALIGLAIGVGGFTFLYAQGASYLTDNPAACANCHVMQEHYDAWTKSSHHAVAACNDCHTPQGMISKYWVKADNGWNHSLAFTTGDFHEPIQIKPRNLRVTEAQCRHCHTQIVEALDGPHGGGESISCIRCHANVGHYTR